MPDLLTPTAARPPAPTAGLSLATRVLDYSVMGLAVVLSSGSVVIFAWSPRLVPMELSPTAALWWNALLSFFFFLQHSVMVRRSVRVRLAAVIPARYDAAFYAISSGVVLTLVALLYQRVEAPDLFVLHGLPRLLVITAALLAIALFAWGIVALRTFDPFGIRPIRRHLGHGSADSALTPSQVTFVVVGPYRWVRHPLYSAVIVLLWADPEMSLGRFELAVLWTAWIFVGTILEERDLMADFGEIYREYRKQVPMLIPWRGPAKAQP